MDPADASPMGVNVDLSTLEGVDPLLLGFLAPKDSARHTLFPAGNQAMQERGWDDCATGSRHAAVRRSAEEAVEALCDRNVGLRTELDSLNADQPAQPR